MRVPFRSPLTALVLLSGLIAAPSSGRAAADPKLLVVLVVDQMRADYVDRYRHQWSGGLKQLVGEGAWFRQAAYPYLTTVTCPGHATIATGSFPPRHGVIQNSWWDRERRALVNCTDDAEAPAVSYGAPVAGGYSITWLRLPTLADEIRAQLPHRPRIVSLSAKPRAAIMMAGRRGDLVLFFDTRQGAWASSAAYGDGLVPFVQEFIARHPVEDDLGQSWTRTLAEGQYLFADAGLGEAPGRPRTATFPHTLWASTPAGSYELWTKSPFADAYLGRLAAASVESLELGRGPGLDFLHVSFSTLDLVGHEFGPWSHEVQDVLIGLDRTIGALVDALDREIGRDAYIVALTSDHGVSPVPEAASALGLDAGRLQTQEGTMRLEAALTEVFGPGRYVARWHYTDIYFEPGVYDRLRADPAALAVAIKAIGAVPGVWRVFRGEDLEQGRSHDDPIARAASLSYYPGRSGDIIIVPKPYWIGSPAAATHGTLHDYDARVPIVLFGAGIKPGQYLEPVTPADIAPTLAFLAGVTLADPDGRVLKEALKIDD